MEHKLDRRQILLSTCLSAGALLASSAATAQSQSSTTTNSMKTIKTIASLKSLTNVSIGDAFMVEDRASGIFDAVALTTTNEFDLVASSALPNISFKLRLDGVHINVRMLGAMGLGGTTNDYGPINRALVLARPLGRKVYFPVNPNSVEDVTNYNYDSTLYFGATGVMIEGESTRVCLKYTGIDTGLKINMFNTDAYRERCGLSTISLVSSTGKIAFDWSGANYGIFENFEVNYTAHNAVHLYAIGGPVAAGPYFNKFDGITMIGADDVSQTGIFMGRGTSGSLADGPNSNMFSNIKRAASLSRALDLRSGTGNLFTNFGAEKISDAMIVLNDLPSLADAGTATSVTKNTLSDASNKWNPIVGQSMNFLNGAVTLASGPYQGETRRITGMTSNTLTLDKPWPDNVGTPAYWIYDGKSVKNLFQNIRQEGWDLKDPDCIRIMPGARGNEIRNIEAGSLRNGKVLDDLSGDPSNIVAQGDLLIETFYVNTLNAVPQKDIIPRSPINSAYGGLRGGSNMVVEYLEVFCPEYTKIGSQVVTILLDHGTQLSLTVKLNSFTQDSAFTANKNKTIYSAANNGILLTMKSSSTTLNVNLIVRVAYRVS